MKLNRQKLELWGYRMVKISWSYLKPFWYDPPVWWTDRQTDGRAMAYSALSIYAICCSSLKINTSDLLGEELATLDNTLIAFNGRLETYSLMH